MTTDLRPGAARLMAMEGQRRAASPIREIQEKLDEALAYDGSLALPGVVSETGLQLPPGLTIEQWQDIGVTLKRISRAWKWWYGDWLNYGEHAYGEMYSQAMDDTGLDYGQLAQIAYVARQIEPYMRRDGLSWSHHAAIASLDKQQQSALLEQAATNRWTRDMLRSAAALLKSGDAPKPRSLPKAATEPREQPVLAAEIERLDLAIIPPAETLSSSCGCHCHTGGACGCGL